jgi:hypothetical protein
VELSKDDLKLIVELFKPIPTLETSMCFKVQSDSLIVGHNVEGVMSSVILPKVISKSEGDFVFLVNRKMIVELYDLIGDTVIFKLKEGNLKIDLGNTELSMLTLEDVEVPNIHIDTESDLETSEKIDPDYIEGALNRAITIKNNTVGILEGYVEVGGNIVCGSAVFFTEVESKVKGVKVKVVPEFLNYMKNIARTASKWVKIYKDKNYVIVANDKGLLYQSSSLDMGFPTSIKAIEDNHKALASFIVDKRALVTSLKKLSLVLVGVKNSTVTLKLVKGDLVLEVKSLNGKLSKDKVALTNVKGSFKSVTINIEVLKTTLSVLEVNTRVKIFAEFTIIEDQEQKVIFSNLEHK